MTQFGQNSRPRESDPSVESIRSAIFTVIILSGHYSITILCALQPEAHAYGKSLHGADDSGRSGVWILRSRMGQHLVKINFMDQILSINIRWSCYCTLGQEGMWPRSRGGGRPTTHNSILWRQNNLLVLLASGKLTALMIRIKIPITQPNYGWLESFTSW